MGEQARDDHGRFAAAYAAADVAYKEAVNRPSAKSYRALAAAHREVAASAPDEATRKTYLERAANAERNQKIHETRDAQLNSKSMARAKDGKYEAGLNRICKNCGQTLGIHGASKPYEQQDLSMGKLCAGFKAVRAPKVPLAKWAEKKT